MKNILFVSNNSIQKCKIRETYIKYKLISTVRIHLIFSSLDIYVKDTASINTHLRNTYLKTLK